MTAEPDDVSRLLAAEETALARQRLEYVTVADGVVTTLIPRSAMSVWNPRFVMTSRPRSTPRWSARTATI